MSGTYLPAGLPRPLPDALDAPFWEAAGNGILAIQRCADCGTWRWGPEWICHHCHSFNFKYEEVKAEGLIYSWERVWHPTHPALVNATPYIIALIELPHAGHVRMVGNLLGDPRRPVAFGARVRAIFEPHEAGDGMPAFTLVQWKLE
jgi:uncharacterized OB-fold protein